MVNENLEFTRVWTNSDDFATYESDEAVVRADMQALYDEIKDFINTKLTASNLPFEETAAVVGASIQDAIESVQRQLVGISQGAVADGSITAEKLVENSVDTGKLVDASVTEEKLADTSVTTEKLVDKSITNEKIADRAITADKISDESVDLSLKTTGVLPVAKGGTGRTTLAALRQALGLSTSDSVMTIPVEQGGTGVTTLGELRYALGLSASEEGDIVPVAKGGTGVATLAELQSNLGVQSVALGGTGATNAATALSNLGGQPKHKTATVVLESGKTTWSVAATGVTANNSIVVTPSPNSYATWVDANIYCSSQGNGTLGFTAESAPATNVTVNVLILD